MPSAFVSPEIVLPDAAQFCFCRRFQKMENLVRDQGVGGSNPLAPIFGFSKIQPVSECLRNGL